MYVLRKLLQHLREREREAVVITRIEKLVNGQSSTEEKRELSSAK
jgi:hypothetical protein